MITTGRQAFRFAVDKAVGAPAGGWNARRRMDEAILARRCRNVFWNALAPVVRTQVGPSPQVDIFANHRPFATPVMITDIWTYAGNLLNLTYWQAPNYLVRLFTTEDTSGVDFFGSANFIDTVQCLTHYRNAFSPTIIDGPSNRIHFNPYYLKIGQMIQTRWRIIGGWTVALTTQLCHEADFRGVIALAPKDIYSQLCGTLKRQVCEQIATRDPETVILDIVVPANSFPADNVP